MNKQDREKYWSDREAQCEKTREYIAERLLISINSIKGERVCNQSCHALRHNVINELQNMLVNRYIERMPTVKTNLAGEGEPKVVRIETEDEIIIYSTGSNRYKDRDDRIDIKFFDDRENEIYFNDLPTWLMRRW